MIAALAQFLGYIVLGGLALIFALVLAAGAWMGANTPARVRYRVGRPEPRLDHDCEFYGDLTGDAKTERMIGLYVASRELQAAAERVEMAS